MKFKGIHSEITDLDLAKGQVVVYLSAFGNKDSDDDVITRGSFRKSLLERGPTSAKPRIKYLAQHDPTRPIGKFLELYEDDYGLKAVGQLAVNTRDGGDYFEFYKEGIITEHSIGYEVIQGQSKTDHYEISEVRIWEGSAVTWGANENTPVIAMAKAANLEPVDYIEKRIQRLTKFLRNSSATDEAHEVVEFEIKSLFSQMKSLMSRGERPHSIDEPIKLDLLSIYKSL